MRLQRVTSSDLFGRGVSSAFLGSFCFRLSLLAGRVGRSASASLIEDLLGFSEAPRPGFELEAMAGDCWAELLAACEDVIEDDEFRGRAGAGGVEFMVEAGKKRDDEARMQREN